LTKSTINHLLNFTYPRECHSFSWPKVPSMICSTFLNRRDKECFPYQKFHLGFVKAFLTVEMKEGFLANKTEVSKVKNCFRLNIETRLKKPWVEIKNSKLCLDSLKRIVTYALCFKTRFVFARVTYANNPSCCLKSCKSEQIWKKKM